MCLCANCKNNGDESEKFWTNDEETDDVLYFFGLLIPFPFFRNIPCQANIPFL